jgi:hypothetical protein
LSITNEILNFFFKRRYSRIEHFRNYPIETQFETFFSLIERAKFTEFGQKYHFAEIKSFEEFQNRVPLSSYEDFFPHIERIMKGEKNILWPTEVEWFSKSSGTTNAKSKFIPVTQESLDECHYRGGKDMFTLYLENCENSQLFDGKTISIGGSLHPNSLNSNTLIGDISAIITKNMPKWAEYFRTPSQDIALLGNWEEKMEAMVKACCHENVVGIAGVPTWTVLLLESIVEKHGIKDVTEIWPNFEVFFHGAVAFGPYRDLFSKKLLPKSSINYMELYNASEGFFAIQDDFSLKDQMLLMLDYGIFYEFIPMDQWDLENPKTCTLDEVEVDKNYALVISTNGGLWRYKIGDTVKFTSKYPFRIKITGRTKQFINAFGEEVIVENADSALSFASKISNVLLKDYTGGPIYLDNKSKGGHEWVVECDKIPENAEEFINAFDAHLKEINSDYEAKRQNDLALVKPKFHFVEEGTFYNWMKQRGKLGGQNKVPRLNNSREYLDEILDFLN